MYIWNKANNKLTLHQKMLCKYSTQIINHFASKSEHFYFNFLSNTSRIPLKNGYFWEIGSRKDWHGAHARVQYFDVDKNGYKHYENNKVYGYYISFNVNIDPVSKLPELTLREDMFSHWAELPKSYYDTYRILAVDTHNHKTYEVPFSKVYGSVAGRKYRVVKPTQYNKCKKRCLVFTLDESVITYSHDFQEDLIHSDYDIDRYQPGFMAHYVFATYRCYQPVFIHQYDRDGNYRTSDAYVSIGEAFHELTEHNSFTMSHSTLKRAVASERLFESGNSIWYLSLEPEHKDISTTIMKDGTLRASLKNKPTKEEADKALWVMNANETKALADDEYMDDKEFNEVVDRLVTLPSEKDKIKEDRYDPITLERLYEDYEDYKEQRLIIEEATDNDKFWQSLS